MLPPKLFASVRATAGVVVEGQENELMRRVKECKDRDEKVVKAFRELGSSKGNLRGEEWDEADSVATFRRTRNCGMTSCEVTTTLSSLGTLDEPRP